jgi:hypothetical protein
MTRKVKEYRRPAFWGPSLWKFIHCVAMTAPTPMTTENKKEYKEFFESLGNVLPCSICRNHYKEYIIDHPVNVTSRKQLVLWTLCIHNHINELNGKEKWDMETLRRNYL